MSGLLLELRRQIAHNRRKAAYEERMRASAQEKPQEVFSQKISYLARLMNSENAPSSYSHCLIPERRRHRNCRR